MNSQAQIVPRQPATLPCTVAASAVVRAAPDRLTELRRDPGLKLPLSALRHVDDQSVVALAAVLEASRQAGLAASSFGAWGIVAAPRYFGRLGLIGAFRRYCAEGAWGISPHLVPQQSQHAAAGLLSHLMGIRGPSLGVGGGPGAGFEGALAAATLLHTENVSGVWLVVTHWAPEPELDDQNRLSPQAVCHALALGLTPAQAEAPRGPRLIVTPNTVVTEGLDLDLACWLASRTQIEGAA